MKTAIQIDFDGTVTIEDVSFLLMDTYIGDIWREYLKEYTEGKISVGTFNRKVFNMLRVDKKTMTDLVLTNERVKIRPGFKELMEYCIGKSFRILIVSNGWDFYIEAILKKLGVNGNKGLEICAAETYFYNGNMKAEYIGPNGKEIEDGFKEAYTKMLVKSGYSVIYVGNGDSDIYPARQAKYIFATDQLLKRCQAEKLDCVPFNDFFEVIQGLEKLPMN